MLKAIYIFILITISCGLTAQNYTQKIFPEDPRTGVFFGRYLAMNNDDALISAYLDYENGSSSGSLYIFSLENNTFVQVSKLFPDDGAVEDYFSYSISSFGEYLITGAHHTSDKGASSGSAYILKKENGWWDFHQKIVPEDGKEADEFGKTVAMDENYAVSCAYLDDDKGINSGSIYLLELKNENWEIANKIFPSDSEPQSQFGLSLDMHKNQIIAGAPFYKGSKNNIGKAYIFEFDSIGWHEVTALQPEQLDDLDQFGTSVKISDNHAFISAIKDDDKGENSGAVYIYSKAQDSKWELKQKISAPDGSAGDGFGIALEGNDTILFVGSYFDDDNGNNSGSVYVFKNFDDQWKYYRKLVPSDSDESDAFGSSLAFNENGLLVGAYSDDDNGFFSGAVYYFTDVETVNTFNPVIEKKVLVYPTIVNEKINIVTPPDVNLSSYWIFDINGHEVKSKPLKSYHEILDFSIFPSGLYIIKINEGDECHLFKFFKK